MGSAREIVCRNFKKREKLFLNYESQKNVSLGDIFFWNGRKAEFNIVTRLEILGITYRVLSIVPQCKNTGKPSLAETV